MGLMRRMNKRPINLAPLRGFLAAAKHASFTRAAAELNLTQSALSRQVQGLEDELEQALFLRTTRKVALTPAGQRLAQVAAAALAEIDAAVAEIRPGAAGRPISVTTFASFASLWLIPRLDAFAERQPGSDVNCLATDRSVDLDAEGVDVALRAVLQPRWPTDATTLFDEVAFLVMSPALFAERPIRKPADLAAHTRIAFDVKHEVDLGQLGWDHWFAKRGVKPVKPQRTLRFSNHDQIIQAALAGQGVALARGALIAEALRDGQLLPVLGPPLQLDIRYFMLVSEAARRRPEVQAFVAWVGEEAARTRAVLGELVG
jgi:LysR family transcriptional regulator, glycine cleavage system transcriptional activator